MTDEDCKKKKFILINAMIAVANAFRARKHSHYTHRKECRYYWCEKCQAWHLTSKK